MRTSPSPAKNTGPAEPAAGKGMPDKTPQASPEGPGRMPDARDASAEASLALPHERDQQTSMTPAAPGKKMKQANSDLKQGRQDTSKSVEMDATYQKQT